MPSVFFLRHEVRHLSDSTFLTELYPNGKKRAEGSLKDLLLLNGSDITTIYCSPFLRVMQTVAPFAREKGLFLKADYALTEVILDPNFKEKSNIIPPEEMLREFNVDEDHLNNKSNFAKELLTYPEKTSQTFERCKLMAKYVCINHKIDFKTRNRGSENDGDVLLGSHMDITNWLIAIFEKYYENVLAKGIDPQSEECALFFDNLQMDDMDRNRIRTTLYKMGCLSTLVDGKLYKFNEGFDSEDGDDAKFIGVEGRYPGEDN